LVDDRLVAYVRENLNREYTEDQIRKVLIKSGYKKHKIDHAIRKVTNYREQVGISWKKEVIIIYTIISLTLSYFSVEFLALEISKSIVLDYILLFSFTIMLAYGSFFAMRKVVSGNLLNLGYILQLGVIIDLILNKRIEYYLIALPLTIFFYTSTYYIVKSTYDSDL